MSYAIVLFDGNGEPKLLTSPEPGHNAAYDEAYSTLKRGVLGHFQFVAVDASSIDAAVGHLLDQGD